MKSVFLLLALFSFPAFSDINLQACMKGISEEADVIQLNLKVGKKNGTISFAALKAKAIQEKTPEAKLTLINEEIEEDMINAQIYFAMINLKMQKIDLSSIKKEDVRVANFKRDGVDEETSMYIVIAKNAVFVGDTNGYSFFAGSTDLCSNL